jgi:hypothetical protein
MPKISLQQRGKKLVRIKKLLPLRRLNLILMLRLLASLLLRMLVSVLVRLLVSLLKPCASLWK